MKLPFQAKLISEFTHAIGNKCDAFVDRPGKATLAPWILLLLLDGRLLLKPFSLRALMVTC